MLNELHLYWLDKNWQSRGVANHYNLIVYPDSKEYKVFVNAFYDYRKPTDIEVKRKSDITDYIKYLDNLGYNEIK